MARLIAASAVPKSYEGPHGPDIWILDSTRIGRRVTGPGSCQLPASWAQISGNHCRVYRDDTQDPPQYFVKDTSSNGTFINGQRVPKNGCLPLSEGDRVNLSLAASGEQYEYIFMLQPPSGASPASAAAEKRKASEPANSAGGTAKRARAQEPAAGVTPGTSDGALFKTVAQLEQRNQGLRKKLEDAVAQRAAVEQKLHAQERSHADGMRELEAKLGRLEGQAQHTASTAAEASQAALDAAQSAAAQAEARAADAETRLAAETDARSKAEQELADALAEQSRLKVAEAQLAADLQLVKEKVVSVKSSLTDTQQAQRDAEQALQVALATRAVLKESVQQLTQLLEAQKASTAAAQRAANNSAHEAAQAKAAANEDRVARHSAEGEAARLQGQLEMSRHAQELAAEREHSALDNIAVQQAMLQAIQASYAAARTAHSSLAAVLAHAANVMRGSESAMDDTSRHLAYALGAAEGNANAAEGHEECSASPNPQEQATQPASAMQVEPAPCTLAPIPEATQPEMSPTLGLNLAMTLTNQVASDETHNEPDRGNVANMAGAQDGDCETQSQGHIITTSTANKSESHEEQEASPHEDHSVPGNSMDLDHQQHNSSSKISQQNGTLKISGGLEDKVEGTAKPFLSFCLPATNGGAPSVTETANDDEFAYMD